MSRALLHGLRIVELSAFVAAPLSGSTLAELGAEVIRVEPPGGGIDVQRWPVYQGRSLYRAGLDQGKRSVTIDTRNPRGGALVRDLIQHAGTVITNLPMRDAWSYDRLVRRRPDLVYVLITGDPDGSAAVDYTVNAATGLPFVTGPDEWDAPVNHVLPAWDLTTGYLAAMAVVAAELHRERTGEGQLITLSLSDVALSALGHLGFIAEAQLEPEPRGRYGNYIFGSYGRDFVTADGRYVMIVALTTRQWQALISATSSAEAVAALERDLGVDLRQEGARFSARERISQIIGAWIRSRDLVDVARTFDSHGVLWGPYRTLKELVRDDPRCSTKNPLFERVRDGNLGDVLRASSPLRSSASPRVPVGPSPELGADTRAVLNTWLDIGQDEIAALERDGVIPRLSERS